MLIKKSRYTQLQIARWLEVSPNTLSQWINNKRVPDIPTLIRIANMFRVDLNYFVLDELDLFDDDIGGTLNMYLAYFRHDKVTSRILLICAISEGEAKRIIEDYVPHWHGVSYEMKEIVIKFLRRSLFQKRRSIIFTTRKEFQANPIKVEQKMIPLKDENYL